MRLPNASPLFLLTLLLCTALSTRPGFGQATPAEAARLGMEIAWQGQVRMPKVGGIVSAQLWVEPSLPRKYAVVELPGRTVRVSADELDRKGVPIGIEEAKKIAAGQAQRIVRKADGFDVSEVTIPRIHLVVVTSDGLVQAMDAESGVALWEQPALCGLSTAPAHPAALSSAGIAVIHGRNLVLIDWKSGKQLSNQVLKYGSANSLAVCNNLAYVSDYSGRMVAYGLGVERKPWSARIFGRPVGTPVTLADQSLCAVASSEGYVYTLSGGEEPSQWNRYETSAAINGSLSAGNGAFYVGTNSGILSKIGVEERIGKIVWEFRTGGPIANPAFIHGKQVFFATEAGSFHSIDDETGFANWSKNGQRIEQPIAVVLDNVLCKTSTGEIVAMNAADGRFVAKTNAMDLSITVINQSTDRVYLIGDSGLMQCLRPRDGLLPKLVAPVATVEETPAEQPPMEEATTAPAAGAEDPFNFGGGAAAAASPFGGAPAGESSSEPAPIDNPFGTGSPF